MSGLLFSKSHEFTVMLRGPTTGLLTHICSLYVRVRHSSRKYYAEASCGQVSSHRLFLLCGKTFVNVVILPVVTDVAKCTSFNCNFLNNGKYLRNIRLILYHGNKVFIEYISMSWAFQIWGEIGAYLGPLYWQKANQTSSIENFWEFIS